MTTDHGRRARRSQPNDLPNRLAALRGNRSAHLGPVESYLFRQGSLREVVALALLLGF
ncbi:MAG: hypothetical protein ACE5HC_03975 [Candidatus Binatia bacterium]